MNIKSSQVLVKEASKEIQTLNANEVKKLLDKNEITLIDIRDIREIWKEGTLKNSIHIPRGMLEFWLDPESTYFKEKKNTKYKKNGFVLCSRNAFSTCYKIFTRYGF